MIVDPAISDEVFPIDEIFSGHKILNTEIYDLPLLLSKLYYSIETFRPVYFKSLFLLQQPLEITDELYKDALSSNQECFL